jgi:hypothetical protein
MAPMLHQSITSRRVLSSSIRNVLHHEGRLLGRAGCFQKSQLCDRFCCFSMRCLWQDLHCNCISISRRTKTKQPSKHATGTFIHLQHPHFSCLVLMCSQSINMSNARSAASSSQFSKKNGPPKTHRLLPSRTRSPICLPSKLGLYLAFLG